MPPGGHIIDNRKGKITGKEVWCRRERFLGSSKSRGVCVARVNVFEIFWRGRRQLNPVWALTQVCRAESAGKSFFVDASYAYESARKNRIFESNAWNRVLG